MFNHLSLFLQGLKELSFVDIWKAVSIAVTGAFGILGLATEFRNKHTKRITRWGWASLTGIVVSSLLGVSAQLIESSHEAKQTLANATAALALAQKADTTLDGIQRLLSPIGSHPDIIARFFVDCDGMDAQTCEKLRQATSPLVYLISKHSYWDDWPLGARAATIPLRIGVFGKEADATRYTSDSTDESSFRVWPDSKITPDLRYQIDLDSFTNKWDAVEFKGQSGLYMSRDMADGKIWLYAISRSTRSMTATGRVVSLDDLTSSTIIADTPLPSWANEGWLKLTDLVFQTKDGRQRQTNICRRVGERGESDPFYRCTFGHVAR